MPDAHAVSEGAARAGTVSVVVCTYAVARRGMLESLIESIAAGSYQPAEVVVVVDRNRPLFDALSGASWPVALRVIESPGSGLSAARNAGWQSVASPLVAFIDDDAVASPDWLHELVDAVDRHGADVVGGAIEPRWTGEAPGWYSPRLGWVVGCSYEGQPIEAARVRNVIGCNMLFRRELLERLGGFDATLGRTNRGLAGCEETELCIRANRNGANVVLIPGAGVAQVLPPDRRRFRYALKRGWDEGRSKRLLVALHGPVLATEATYARALLRQAARLAGSGIVRRSAGDLRRAAGLVAVLSSTTASYVVHGLRRPARRAAARGHATAG
jgi:GT2 family glycosyltransferase